MHPDIFTPVTYLILFLLCLATDAHLTVKHLFEDNLNWAAFRLAEKDNLLDVEINEVNKMLSCKDESRGFFTHECEHCGITKTGYFRCNSRICTSCGKNHTDKWAKKSLQNALFNVPHRHAVFTIQDALWPIVRRNRFLQKVLMDAAIVAINDTISHKHRTHRPPFQEISRGILRSSPKRIQNHKQTKDSFKMIWHYGAYSRGTKRKYSGYLQRSLRQATFEDFITKVNKWAPKCPNCGRKMAFVCYEKGPPIHR